MKNKPKSGSGHEKPNFNPTPRIPLTVEDFDFSRLPVNELVPCLIYEFLRESAVAKQLATDWAELFSQEKNDLEQQALWARTDKIIVKINHEMDFSSFVRSLFAQIWGFKNSGHLAWQQLSKERRRWFLDHFTHVAPPVFLSQGDIHTEQLNQTMQKSTKKAGDRTPNGGILVLPPARAKLQYLAPRDSEALCVIVSWGTYDDNQILRAFDHLAKEVIRSRPTKVKPRSLSGSGLQRKAEWRGMLNSLGLARLAGRYTASELRTSLPEVYGKIAKPLADQGTTAIQKKLDGATRRFIKRFHQILAFEKNLPLCLRQILRNS